MNSFIDFHDDENIVSYEVVCHRIVLLDKVLVSYKESIDLLKKYGAIVDTEPTKENKQLCASMRDAMFKRFNCCAYLLWKTLTLYLQNIEQINIVAADPRRIVRETVLAKFVTENEGMELMQMIDVQNKIPDGYLENIAEELAHEIPRYYSLLKKLIDRMQEVIAKK